MYRRLPVLALFLCAGSVAAQQSDSIPLTRARAVALARTNNPQLAAAREQIAEARANRVTGIAIPDPAATASLDQQPGFLRSSASGQRNVGATMAVPFPDKFRLNNNIGNANIDAAIATYDALAQQISVQTAQRYDSLLVALRHRGDLLEAQQLAQDFLRRTQARFDAGTAPRLDVIRAQVDVASATNDLIANQRDIVTAQAALERLIGVPVGGVVVPTDTLAVPDSLPTLAVLQAAALRNRPEISGAQAEQRGARSATTLAREFWLPDITLGVAQNVAPGGGPAYFSTGLAFPLPILFWQHTRGDVAFAEHRERELAANARDIVAAVAQDVRTAYANASTALQQVLFIRDQLIPAARAAYRSAAASYAIGGSSAFEVIDARRTLLDAESQYANALANANTAREDLERAASVSLGTLPPAPRSSPLIGISPASPTPTSGTAHAH